MARRPDDELLLLASDGLWDVLSNQEAVTLAKRCLRRALQRGASRQSAARIAATVLTRAAFDRGSRHASLDWLLSLNRTTTSRECWARRSTSRQHAAPCHPWCYCCSTSCSFKSASMMRMLAVPGHIVTTINRALAPMQARQARCIQCTCRHVQVVHRAEVIVGRFYTCACLASTVSCP